MRETLRPGAVANIVADQHGIGTGLLYTWRKQMLTAAMTGFAAVEVTPEPQAPPLPDGPSLPRVPAQVPDHGSAAMDAAAEIDLPDGTRVRVGNAHNSTELYEHAFESAEDANEAMLDAGILTKDQVPDPTKPAGTGLTLTGITVQQLEAAGLKRHGASSL